MQYATKCAVKMKNSPPVFVNAFIQINETEMSNLLFNYHFIKSSKHYIL